MPKQYEELRDQFIKQGLSASRAKEKAARIYNSKNPDKPVGASHGASHGGKKRGLSTLIKRQKGKEK